MYASFFGLRCLPFEDRADTQFCFATPEFTETLAALEYEAHYGRGLALVVGEAGTGKTLLVRTLLLRLDKTDHAVVLTWSSDGGADLVRECCKGFGVTLSSSQNHARGLNRLRRHLARVAAAGERAILIIDQAENLSPDNLAQLAALLELEGERGPLLRVFLAAQPRVRCQLDRAEFARIRQQFGERILSSLGLDDTRAYILHRLQVAGASDREIMEAGAVCRIHERSGGVPRLINRIGNAVMLGAYGAGVSRVTGAMVDEVAGRSVLCQRTLGAEHLALPGAAMSAAWPSTQPAHTEHEPSAADPAIDMDGVVGAVETDALFEEDPPAPSGGGAAAVIRLERAIAKAERMTSTTQASLSQLSAIERHLSSLLDRADAVSKTFAPAIQHGVDAVERTQQRFAHILHEARQGAADVESRWSRASVLIERLEETIVRAEAVRDGGSQVESRLTAAAEGFADRAQHVHEQLTRLMEGLEAAQRTHAAIEAANVQATAIRSGLEEQGRVTQREVEAVAQAACAKIETVARRLTSSASDSEGKTAAAWENLQRSIRDAEQVSQRLTDDVVRGVRGTLEREVDSAVGAVSTAAQQAAEKLEASQRSILDAASKRCRVALQSDLAAVERTAGEVLEGAQTKLDGLLKRSSQAASDAKAAVESQAEKLAQAVGDARHLEADISQGALPRARAEWRELLHAAEDDLHRVTTQMEQLLARRKETEASVTGLLTASTKASTIQTALDGLISHADDKAARLASQHAAASSVIERLSTGNVAAQQLVERIGQRSGALEGALQSAEATADSLRKQQDAVGPQKQQLADLVQSARRVSDSLATQNASAEQNAAILAARQGDAGKLVEQLDGVHRALTAATEMSDNLGRAVQQAETVSGALATLSTKAAPQCETLGDLSSSATTMLATFEQLRNDAGAALDRLAERLATHAAQLTALDDGNAQAAARIEAVRVDLDELSQKAEVLGSKLEPVLAQPSAVLEQIHAESLQLERVCAAVRKVFAALSQAALDARRQADELHATGQDASNHCSHLTSQTAKAGAVLREWVEEAVRAQSRLERALAECPSLASTHPGEAVRGASRMLDQLVQDGGGLPMDELGRMDEPPAVEHPSPPRTTSRSQEIARLIAEASQHT